MYSRKILVVGGTGYLGRRVIKALSEGGNQIVCTYIKGEDCLLFKEQFGIELIPCNVQEIEQVLLDRSFDWVMNFAALYENRDVKISSIIQVNTILGIQLLSFACEYEVDNFLTVDTSLPDKFNLYSFSKKRVADFGKYLSERNRINFINLKPEMFYGTDEPKNRFIRMCIDKMKANENIKLTEGTQIRDIIHIDDVVGIIMQTMDSELVGYHDLPIGTGASVSVREIVEYIKKITGSKSVLEFGALPCREGEPDCTADLGKLFDQIGIYKFKYDWKSGLRKVIGGE